MDRRKFIGASGVVAEAAVLGNVTNVFAENPAKPKPISLPLFCIIAV